MAKLTLTGPGDPAETADFLCSGIQNSGMSCELVDFVRRGGCTVMVFEKYYWRASNRASLTVVVSGEDGAVTVDAIGSGGGQGPLFKMSWGAEESFAGTVEDLLRDRDFTEQG